MIGSMVSMTVLAAGRGEAMALAGAVLLGVGLIVAVIVVGRRILLADASRAEDRQTFSLLELRRFRDQGVLTEEEYQRAKQALLARERDHLQGPADHPDEK